MTDHLDVPQKHRRTLEALIHEHVPGVEVWAYGSRVNGRGHAGSDLDLVLRAPGLEEIPADRLSGLVDGVRESTIPFLVEARDWARLPARFHREIQREYVVLCVSATNPETTLGDHFTLQRGTTYKSRLLGRDGPVLLGLASMHRNGGFRADALRTYGGDCPEKLLVHPGELYVSLKDVTQSADLLGAVAMLPAGHASGRLTQDTVKLVPKRDDIRLDYIHWLLRTPDYRHYCRAHATGTTNLGLPREDFLAYRVPPLTPKRECFVDVLNALDSKIEVTRRVNETLEAIARAFFKSWFLDFDPVRAKMAGRDAGLPDRIETLFPSEMVQTEALDVPVGWRTGTLAEVAVARRHNVAPADCGDQTPYIGLEHMPRRSIALGSWGFAGSVKSAKSRFRKGDILFGKLRPYFHKVGIAPVEGVCSTDIVVIASKSPEWSAFVSATVSSDHFVTYTDQTSTGTKMPRTSWKTMSQYGVCIPPRELASVYQEAVQPILDKIVDSTHSNMALASLRDALLPKLISGELRVPDAERIVAAVT